MDNALIIAIAESENGDGMRPVARGGRLAVFGSIESARRAAGPLGVGVPITPARGRELCREFGLKLPDLRQLVQR